MATALVDGLPQELEHFCHSFLHISEVCALRGVCKSWQNRIDKALRKLPWDISHRSGSAVGPAGHFMLEELINANVKIRSVSIVRIGVSQLYLDVQ